MDVFSSARPWFSGRRALVVGLGKSGAAAARLLHRLGAAVTVTDTDAGAKAALPAGVRREIGHRRALDQRWDLAVLSPGVPPSVLRTPPSLVWGEMELACRALTLAGRWPRDTAAITGTNGKTTTTALLGAMAKADGRRTFVGGNIGTPLSALADQIDRRATLILEVSSYQLETAFAFRPRVGVLLNVTPDHLGRHGSMENYAAAKFRLFQSQSDEDVAVLNAADPWCRRYAGRAPGRVVWINGRDYNASARGIRGPGGFWKAPAFLPGRHNLENAQAAIACAQALGIRRAAVADGLAAFPGVEHRLEVVRDRAGVRYVNDSKATNVDSTLVALRSFTGRLHLILGGEDKGAPYKPLRGEISRKVRQILLIGEAAPKIAKQLRGAAPMADCGTLERAVSRAAVDARPGEVVLLSPACASFDQFDNFEHRGRRFKELVKKL